MMDKMMSNHKELERQESSKEAIVEIKDMIEEDLHKMQ